MDHPETVIRPKMAITTKRVSAETSSLITYGFGSYIGSFNVKQTLANAKVAVKRNAPSNQPIGFKGPSRFGLAFNEAIISGAPFAKAISVIAASAGLNLNFLERSAIPTDKYLSATEPISTNKAGNIAQMKIKSNIAF